MPPAHARPRLVGVELMPPPQYVRREPWQVQLVWEEYIAPMAITFWRDRMIPATEAFWFQAALGIAMAMILIGLPQWVASLGSRYT